MSPKKAKSNYISENSNKSFDQLSVELEKLRIELTRIKLKGSTNQSKDTNLTPKIKRKIAQILTIINQKNKTLIK